MDIQTVIIVLIPSVLSSAIAITQIVLNYKKGKEPKRDEIWETTTKLLVSGEISYMKDADGFAEMYRELFWFKSNGCKLGGEFSLRAAMRKEEEKHNKQKERDQQKTQTNSQDETQMSDD